MIEDGPIRAWFRVSCNGQKFKGFSIPKVLNWYLDSTGLRGLDFLFPRFRYEKGKVVAQGGYYISYSSSAL